MLTVILAAPVSLPGCKPYRAVLPSCPPGAIRMGAPPPKGEEVWCQKMVEGKPVKDGFFILYGAGGDKLLEGAYRDGKQQGEWTMWYENGRRAAVDHYRDGLQNGPHTSWYANGVKAVEGNYRDGRRAGNWQRWEPSGRKSGQQLYENPGGRG